MATPDMRKRSRYAFSHSCNDVCIVDCLVSFGRHMVASIPDMLPLVRVGCALGP